MMLILTLMYCHIWIVAKVCFFYSAQSKLSGEVSARTSESSFHQAGPPAADGAPDLSLELASYRWG